MDSLLQDLVDGIRQVVQSGRDPVFLAGKIPAMLEDGFQLVMGDADPSHALAIFESLGGIADCRTLLQQFHHFPPQSPSSPASSPLPSRSGSPGKSRAPKATAEDNANLSLCLAALKILLLDGLLDNSLSLVDSLQELAELVGRAISFRSLGGVLQGITCVLLTCGVVADSSSNHFLHVSTIRPAHQTLIEALGPAFSASLLDLVASLDPNAPEVRFTIRCALKTQHEVALHNLAQGQFSAARIGSDFHIDALIKSLRSPAVAPEAADLLSLHVAASRWDKHHRPDAIRVGTDLIETSISAVTHAMQLSAIVQQNSRSPVVQEALTPEIPVLMGLLCSVLAGGRDTAPSTSVGARALRILQASFSYQHEWVGAGSRSSHLVAAALSTGLVRLHRLLLQCKLVDPFAPLSIQGLPFVAHSAAFTGHSSSLRVEPGSTTCISMGACATQPGTVAGSVVVQFEPDQVAPQRLKLSYGDCGGMSGSKLVAYNSDAPSFALELLRTGEYSEASAACCAVVTNSLILVHNDNTFVRKGQPSMGRGELHHGEINDSINCSYDGEPCLRCKALVAEQVASMESTIIRTEKQRDDLVDCVSALRTDVELTSNHVVAPLQAEVASLRKKLAASQKELLMSLTVVKELTGVNEELHTQLRDQEGALQAVEQERMNRLKAL